ncbi:MAG: UbiA family prenyltransferase [Bacteroidetes bacterium]|nr:UbiA family prenyltransferase [Bacteroidota bacterium]
MLVEPHNEIISPKIAKFALQHRGGKLKDYLSLVKFSHTIFAMPFAMIGFFLAIYTNGQSFDIKLLLLVILCMIFARSAAMAFNRYIDSLIDSKNPRTAIREIPAGILSRINVLWFVIINSILFMATTWFINPLCFYLSFVALFVILGYSYTKRFTYLCHFFLGVGLSLAPIGAYIAVTSEFDSWLPVLFSLTVFCWVTGFDIIYALQDEQFDRSQKLHSIPVMIGKSRALNLSTILHVLAMVFIILAGVYGEMSWLYWVGCTCFSGLLIYQHTLIKPNDLTKINLAFFTTNGIASVIFAMFVISDFLILS